MSTMFGEDDSSRLSSPRSPASSSFSSSSPARLVVVVGQLSDDERTEEAIRKRFVEDLTSSWNASLSRCDLNKELARFVTPSPFVKSGSNCECSLVYKSPVLNVEFLVRHGIVALHDKLTALRSDNNHDSPFTLVVYVGLTLPPTGLWLLFDGPYQPTTSVDGLCPTVFEISGKQGVDTSPDTECNGIEAFCGRNPVTLRDVQVNYWDMHSSDFLPQFYDRPTLYVLPAGQGSCAFFGAADFSALFEMGYESGVWGWELVRRLKRLDVLLLTNLGVHNLIGTKYILGKMRAMDERTRPKIGHAFVNCPRQSEGNSTDVFVKKEGENVASEACERTTLNWRKEAMSIVRDLKRMRINLMPCMSEGLETHSCLYHKVGVGSVCIDVLSPGNDERLRQFLESWKDGNNADADLTNGIPTWDAFSICAVVRWAPAKQGKPVRILLTGGAPESVVFTGLEKLKRQSKLGTHSDSHSCLCKDALGCRGTKEATKKPEDSKKGNNGGRIPSKDKHIVAKESVAKPVVGMCSTTATSREVRLHQKPQSGVSLAEAKRRVGARGHGSAVKTDTGRPKGPPDTRVEALALQRVDCSDPDANVGSKRVDAVRKNVEQKVVESAMRQSKKAGNRAPKGAKGWSGLVTKSWEVSAIDETKKDVCKGSSDLRESKETKEDVEKCSDVVVNKEIEDVEKLIVIPASEETKEFGKSDSSKESTKGKECLVVGSLPGSVDLGSCGSHMLPKDEVCKIEEELGSLVGERGKKDLQGERMRDQELERYPEKVEELIEGDVVLPGMKDEMEVPFGNEKIKPLLKEVEFPAKKSELPAKEIVELPAKEIVELPAKEIVELPAKEIVELPAKEIGELPAKEIVELPAKEIVELPAKKIVEQPAKEIVELPAKEIVELPAKEIVELPAKEIVELPAKEIGELPAKEIGELPAKEIGELPAKEIGELPAKEIGELPAKEIVELPAKEIVELPAKEIGELPAKEIGELPAKEIVELPAKEIGELPAKEIVELPAKEIGELPAKEIVELPAKEIVELPAKEIVELPAKEIVELPAKEIVELPAKEIGELPAKEKELPSAVIDTVVSYGVIEALPSSSEKDMELPGATKEDLDIPPVKCNMVPPADVSATRDNVDLPPAEEVTGSSELPVVTDDQVVPAVEEVVKPSAELSATTVEMEISHANDELVTLSELNETTEDRNVPPLAKVVVGPSKVSATKEDVDIPLAEDLVELPSGVSASMEDMYIPHCEVELELPSKVSATKENMDKPLAEDLVELPSGVSASKEDMYIPRTELEVVQPCELSATKDDMDILHAEQGMVTPSGSSASKNNMDIPHADLEVLPQCKVSATKENMDKPLAQEFVKLPSGVSASKEYMDLPPAELEVVQPPRVSDNKEDLDIPLAQELVELPSGVSANKEDNMDIPPAAKLEVVPPSEVSASKEDMDIPLAEGLVVQPPGVSATKKDMDIPSVAELEVVPPSEMKIINRPKSAETTQSPHKRHDLPRKSRAPEENLVRNPPTSTDDLDRADSLDDLPSTSNPGGLSGRCSGAPFPLSDADFNVEILRRGVGSDFPAMNPFQGVAYKEDIFAASRLLMGDCDVGLDLERKAGAGSDVERDSLDGDGFDPGEHWEPMKLPEPEPPKHLNGAKVGGHNTNEQRKKPNGGNHRKPYPEEIESHRKSNPTRGIRPKNDKAKRNTSDNTTSSEKIVVQKITKNTEAPCGGISETPSAIPESKISKGKTIHHSQRDKESVFFTVAFIPGRGEPEYATKRFFQVVHAHYYVLSSVGNDLSILDGLLEAKEEWEEEKEGRFPVSVIVTHRSKALEEWVASRAEKMLKLNVDVRKAADECNVRCGSKIAFNAFQLDL